jgi:hypothetical protein
MESASLSLCSVFANENGGQAEHLPYNTYIKFSFSLCSLIICSTYSLSFPDNVKMLWKSSLQYIVCLCFIWVFGLIEQAQKQDCKKAVLSLPLHASTCLVFLLLGILSLV